MNNEKFGSFIRELRREKNITQKQLSEALGVTDKAVSKWERGLSFPDITLLTSIADYFGVNVSELLEGERGAQGDEAAIDESVKQAEIQAQLAAARRIRDGIKRILRLLLPCAFAVCAVLQIGYLLILKPRGYEYIYDFLFYLFNAVAILCAGIFSGLILKSKRVCSAVFAVCAVLMLANCAFLISDDALRSSTVSYSKNLKNAVVVKTDEDTGGATYYRNPRFILFSKPKEELESEVSGKIKTQWLETDICALTWLDTGGALHTFTATYGSRGSTVSYDYVAPALLGDWKTKSGKQIKLLAESKGITVISDQTEFFEYSDCRQFGTTALVLYSGNVPRYTVALGRDCEIDQKSGIIKSGGTVILCEVSAEKTAAHGLYCTTHKDSDLSDYSVIDIDKNSYVEKNGSVYVSYDGKTAIPLPYSVDELIIEEGKYIISEEKTVFIRRNANFQSLIISDDKAVTWNETVLEEYYSIMSMQFLNSEVGYIFEVCDAAMGTAIGRISKTCDGGTSWETLFEGFPSSNGTVFKSASEFLFTDENIGFITMPSAGGEHCLLYRSTDGGKSFEPFKPCGEEYDFLTLPAYTDDALKITASGGSDSNTDKITLKSTDNGLTWETE